MKIDINEAIAVVGLDLKFPGDAVSPEDFYKMLLRGRSALSEIPSDRYNVDSFYHPDAERAGATNVRHAHFIREDIAAFDAPFFSIPPAEAMCMDPQQRGLLESVYRALENSGIPLSRAIGSSTSVYVGCFTREYDNVLSRDPEIDLKYIATGTGAAMLSNRLSWFYDFHGPSLTLDTACSSSLNAVHLACTSLKLRETSMAVVAGCNLFYNPDTLIPLTSLGFLSPDGKCYSFDHRANGYSRGEGFGVLVLKRISDAVRDQDTIRAVIRSTTSNQDGRSPGVTQPTKKAQVELIRAAYENAGLDLGSTRYFEAHGTGTQVGDPIEASAISDVFTAHRSPDDPLYIGAVKSNIGHLEGAAGIAGLLKTIFVLERGIIPPNIWFEKANPKIPAEEWNFKFPTAATAWPNEGLRRASVNSFGYGGSNSHVIMEDAFHYLSMHNLNGRHRTALHPKLAPETANDHVDDEVEVDPEQKANGHLATVSRSMGTAAAKEFINGLDDLSKTDGKGGASDVHKGLHNTTEGNGTNTESDLRNGHSQIQMVNGTGSVDGTYVTNDVQPRQLNCDHHHVQTVEPRERVFLLSSFDEDGIRRLVKLYHEHLVAKSLAASDQQSYLDDLSYTLAYRRSTFTWRVSVIANTLASLVEKLDTTPKPIRSGTDVNLAFAFTGQGAQHYAMGRGLLAYPVFSQSLWAADKYLQEIGCRWSLVDEYLKDETCSSIHDPEFSQPICSALQVALVELLASWSIFPKAVVGHSSGEIAAAFAVGAISRESAWKLAYHRGMLSSVLAHSTKASRGGMLVVALGPERALDYIARIDKLISAGSLTVACLNSPTNVTISGSVEKIDALKEMLDAENIFARKLRVNNAYHSVYMEAVADDYLRLIADVQPGSGFESGNEPQFYSSLTGSLATSNQLQNPMYWVDNLISPVRFSEAATHMFADWAAKGKKRGSRQTSKPLTEILEIGPHGALRGPLREILGQSPSAKNVGYEAMLKRGDEALQTALVAVGWLFCRGHAVDIYKINHGSFKNVSPTLLVNLPSYPFNHSKTYWKESRISKGYRFRQFPRHELLGAPVPDWNKNNAIWRNWIRLGENAWIKDHRIMGSTLYPAAGMLVMAIEASRQLANPEKKLKGFRFREVVFQMALRIPSGVEGVETHFYLRPYLDSTFSKSSSWSEFQLSSHESDEWRDHCRGLIQTEYETPYTPVDNGLENHQFTEMCVRAIDAANESCQKDISTKQLYELLATAGFDFGPSFQTLSDIRIRQDRDMIATNKAPDIRNKAPHGYIQPHLIHPTTLDGVLQSSIVAMTRGGREARETMLPTSIKELWITADSSAVHEAQRVYAKARYLGLRQGEASLIAIDPVSRKPLIVADGYIATIVSSRNLNGDENIYRHLCFNVDWKPDPSFVDREIATRIIRPRNSLLDVDPSQIIADVEAACYMYMKRYMNSKPQHKVKDMKPHHQKYMAWMQHQLNRYEHGEPPYAKSDWKSLAEDDAYFADLELRLEASTPEGKLCVAVGKALPQILSGEIDPLQVFFNNKLVENVYRFGTGAEITYGYLTGYLDTIVHKNPGMKILEVGAGTGGATVPVMETLMRHGENEFGAGRFQSYDFTDISPSFFEMAKETFQMSMDRMNFRTLDIENDPMQQGFEAEQYDIIIAWNVLHATKIIDVTLRNVRKLLKHGGKLLLGEVTNTALVRPGFGFGLLPGWWLSEEPYREWGPLMSVQDWSSNLQRTGFRGVDISFDDFSKKENQLHCFVVATAAEPTPKLLNASATLIVADEQSRLQMDIAERMQRDILSLGTPLCEITPLDQLHKTDFEKKLAIFLPEVERPFLDRVSQGEYMGLQKMILSLDGILWLTQGGGQSSKNPSSELVTGFARTIRAENPTLKFITLSIESIRSPEVVNETAIKIFDAVFAKGDKQVVDNSFFESDGIIHISRVIEANYMNMAISNRVTQAVAQPDKFGGEPDRPLKLYVGSPGLLDTLQFDDDPVYGLPLLEGEVEFQVKACGLNFLDIMVSLGQVIGTDFGAEGSGVVTRTGPNSKFKVGDRVCGIAHGTMGTFARTQEMHLTKIPDGLSWTSASSLPVVYATAYAALYDTANVQKRESVLIHAAAGGVGQACIQLAQLRGAEVYATVGSIEKRDLLELTYAIPRDHILSSRDLTFAQGIKRMTMGRGVDVVVNSLSGAGLRASWECVAPFGRFVEIGKVDVYSSARLNMEKFKKNVSFAFVDVSYMGDNDLSRFNRILEDVMRLWREGRITEVKPVQVYPFSKIQDAYRYMQSGAHSGKIVLEPHEEDVVTTVPSRKPAYSFDPHATYVISGGLGGLGRSTARWMASRGAKNLILLSRTGATRESAMELVADLEAKQVNVATPPCDVTNAESLRLALNECLTHMPPIKGCIQGSMVLKDAMFENMTIEDWYTAVRPKVQASWNLHETLPKDLDFFILLSSSSGMIGNRGQANYCAGNSYQDALARHRICNGLKATSLDLCTILSVGFVAENTEIDLVAHLRGAGFCSMREEEYHAVLDELCNPHLEQTSPLKAQISLGFEIPENLRSKGLEKPEWMSDPLFRHLFQIRTFAGSGDSAGESANYRVLLIGAESHDAATEIIFDALVKKLCKLLNIESQDVEPSKPLLAFGIDSLVAVELRTWLLKEMAAEVAIFEMLAGGSVRAFAALVATRSNFVKHTETEE